MAWEELLQLHDSPKEIQPLPGDEKARDSGSLIQQVRELVGQTGEESAADPADDGEVYEPRRFGDGYVRRSPVQAYTTAEDYARRKIRRIIMIVLGVFCAVLLVYALMKSGLLIFRLR